MAVPISDDKIRERIGKQKKEDRRVYIVTFHFYYACINIAEIKNIAHICKILHKHNISTFTYPYRQRNGNYKLASNAFL